MKILLVTVSLIMHCAAFGSTEVRVKEFCDNRDCFVLIQGPAHRCVKKAREKSWSNGLDAAKSVRDCLDKAGAQ